ncbi:hypothetical protein MRX96_043574 [Rhipicephalus microplus]
MVTTAYNRTGPAMTATTRVCYDSYASSQSARCPTSVLLVTGPSRKFHPTTGSKSGPIAQSAPPLRDITLHESRACRWPNPGNANAPVPSTPTPGHSQASIPPTFQRRRCRSRHWHHRCCISNATTPLAVSPTSRVRVMWTSQHVPALVDLCAHGSTTDAAQHANR